MTEASPESSEASIAPRRRSKRQLVLPPGAAGIIQAIAAERILHQMMADQLFLYPSRPLESAALERLMHDFPQLCRTTYEFAFGQKGQCRLVSYHPLHVILRFQPPWSLVHVILQAFPEALNVRDASGIAPIHIACKFHAHVQVLEGLNAWHAGIMGTRASASRWLPLHFVCASKRKMGTIEKIQSTQQTNTGHDESDVDCGILRVLQLFPKAASTPEALNGSFPVHLAIAAGHSMTVIQALFEAGGSEVSSMTDRHGRNPLHYACRYGAPLSVVEYLVEHDVKSNNSISPVILTQTHTGYTALHLAAAFSTVAVLQYVLDSIACTFDSSDTNSLSAALVHAPTGCTLLHLAVQRDNDCSMIQYLAERFPHCLMAKESVREHTPLHTAAAVAPKLVPLLNELKLKSIAT